MIHKLGDPDSTMGGHRVGAARIMSHDNGVVNRQPGSGGLRRGGWMSLLVHLGGLGKA
jgi:hypothetical protein